MDNSTKEVEENTTPVRQPADASTLAGMFVCIGLWMACPNIINDLMLTLTSVNNMPFAIIASFFVGIIIGKIVTHKF